jgi:hypothetical protein
MKIYLQRYKDVMKMDKTGGYDVGGAVDETLGYGDPTQNFSSQI